MAKATQYDRCPTRELRFAYVRAPAWWASPSGTSSMGRRGWRRTRLSSTRSSASPAWLSGSGPLAIAGAAGGETTATLLRATAPAQGGFALAGPAPTRRRTPRRRSAPSRVGARGRARGEAAVPVSEKWAGRREQLRQVASPRAIRLAPQGRTARPSAPLPAGIEPGHDRRGRRRVRAHRQGSDRPSLLPRRSRPEGCRAQELAETGAAGTLAKSRTDVRTETAVVTRRGGASRRTSTARQRPLRRSRSRRG
jgi:hypothetical protein